MCACIHEYHVYIRAQENQKWALDPLVLELQVVLVT